MNLFRSSTILIIGLVILVAERIYFVNKNDVDLHNAEHQDSATDGTKYNEYIQGALYAKSNNTVNTNAYSDDQDSEKNVLHSPNGRLTLSNNGKAVAKKSDSLWQKYIDQMPKVFMLTNAAKTGVDYNENNIATIKQLAYSGDTLAKFLYAYRLSKPLEVELQKTKGAGDTAYWTGRTTEIRQLYIDSASHGLHASAHELSRLYNMPQLRDIVEALSWALIADSMRGDGDKSLSHICNEQNKAPCSNESLSLALKKAKHYLNIYSFKIVANPPAKP